LKIQQNIILSQYTTLQLGGEAKLFCECTSIEEIKGALHFAKVNNHRLQILGGGSNTIFSDDGFDGVVLKVNYNGISYAEDGNDILVTANAGVDWEKFTATCVEKGYAGVECLSGIPGLAGAVPIQNVGAYGQEVKDTIEHVSVVERDTMKEKIFTNAECRFSYRQSRFKSDDAGKFVVTGVTFRLRKNGRPTINYPEVKKIIDSHIDLPSLADGRESLNAVRNIVLSLRKKKSMVIDPNDPNTKSVGSFFMNPVVDNNRLLDIRNRWNEIGDGTLMPVFSSEEKTKIPAAWLIEKSGFKKGYMMNGSGISENHTLALVNRGGTTTSLLMLAEEIRNGVEQRFGVKLEYEANLIL
jgi:UDP-N-acetylmuramate dehydrogenase